MAAGWGKVNNWAAEVEEEEAQNGGSLPLDDFPSLEVAKTAAPKSKKKEKPTKMSLSTFISSAGSGGLRNLSDKEILTQLPTGSRGKVNEPETGGLGGAFKQYGRGDYEDRERERRPRQEDMGPSRADEADDWGKDKKFAPGSSSSFGGGYESRSGGYGGFDRSRERGEPRESGPSRADESEAWGRDKNFQPSSRGFEDRERGFGDREGGRGFGNRSRGGFGDRERNYGGDRPEVDSDWGRGRTGAQNGFDTSSRDRDRGYNFSEGGSRGDAVDRWTRNRESSTNDTEDRRTERPRLNLKPRTVPVEEGNGTAEPAAAPQPRKSNPFGNARPREEVLKEKGVDYKKEELKLEHDASLRPDTEEEQKLKDDIEILKTKLEALSANDSTDPEEIQELKNDIESKETHLLKLAAELDDRVKYAKENSLREGSGERGRGRENSLGRDRREGERRGFSGSRDRFDQSRERSGW